ncbi:MAG: L,D-transpeptidase family protein [Steroidobacter sp.]
MRLPLKGTASRLPIVAIAALSFTYQLEAADTAWRDAQQLVLVTTPDWNSNAGTLQTFEYANGEWKLAHGAAPVAIGRAGSAWGVGLHTEQAGPIKKEGDGRSPAGVFRIGDAFGYNESAPTALQYKEMNESNYCIDVSGSPLYNRIVDARLVGQDAIKGSTEPMRLDIHADGDVRYKLGFVIEHNVGGEPQAGSCIFAHLWRSAGEPTSGCTSMDESVMHTLLGWLQPEQHPVFVLLPQAEYARLKARWKLPEN